MGILIESETKLQRAEKIADVAIDNEIALMHIDEGKYFGLNSVGSAIWSLLKEPKTFAELSAELLSLYDVDREACERETKAFIEAAIAKKILVVS